MSRKLQLRFEPLERRDLMAADTTFVNLFGSGRYYSIDGTGNNLAHPEWGSAGETLLRTAAAEYGDGISTPAGADRPSAREISNLLVDSGGEDKISDRQLSAMIYVWGQFIDHDLGLTPSADPKVAFPILIPEGDPFFDPEATGTKTMSLNRSAYDPTTGQSSPREQINTLTAWLDGSMVYGSDVDIATSLRTFQAGLLKTSPGDLLPVDDEGAFLAGDDRANENIELSAMQTLFMREHNYWARRLAAANPRLSDEQLYQQARAIVTAEIQSITYNQWLPALLGYGAIDRYTGYDPSVNPGIANEFSTAAFRLGHSLLGDDVEFLDNNGNEVGEEVPLSEAFSNPDLVREFGIDPILKYLASDPASELDNEIVGSVRNFLFGQPGAGGLDLASLNIQRGRDHGLADFNSVREAYGLPAVTSFDQITSDPEVAAKLSEAYGSVDNIDLWVGLLAEDHARGSSVGPTLRAIVSDQFERLRDGDRLWYERTFSGRMLDRIEHTTLTDVLKRNTTLTNLQDNTFFFRAAIGGTVFADANGDGRQGWRERGVAGKVVELLDGEGEVLATATTDFRGRYMFDVDDGIRTGDYTVRIADSQSAALSLATTVSITRGDQFRVVNLPVSRNRSPVAATASTDATSVADTSNDVRQARRRFNAEQEAGSEAAAVDAIFAQSAGAMELSR